jgi:tetratricopeptide (TPR) repeat protein
MKHRIPILIILKLLIAISAYNQSIPLFGVTLLAHKSNSIKKAILLQGVYVSAEKSIPTISDQYGKFTLEFVGIDLGNSISINCEYPQHQVVNKDDIQNITLGRHQPIKILFAEERVLADIKADYYGIGNDILDQFTAEIRILVAKDKEGQTIAKQRIEKLLGIEFYDLDAAISALLNEYAKKHSALPETAQKLAEIELSCTDSIESLALALLKEGKILGALEILKDTTINNLLAQVKAISMNTSANNEATEKTDSILVLTRSKLLNMVRTKKAISSIAFNSAEEVKARETEVEVLRLIHADNPTIEFLRSLQKLGVLLIDRGELAKSKKYFNEAQTVAMDLGLENTQEMAAVLSNKAIMYYSLDLADTALAYQEQAIRIQQAISPGLNPNLAVSYSNLSLILAKKSLFNRALKIQLEAISIMENVESMDPSLLFTARINLVSLYEKLGKFNEAQKELEKANSSAPVSLHETANIKANYHLRLSTIHAGQGLFRSAIENSKLGLAILDSILPIPSVLYADGLSALSQIYLRIGEIDSSLAIENKALGIRLGLLPANHTSIGVSNSSLARILMDLGEYDKAKSHLITAIEIFEENKSVNISRLVNSYKILASLVSIEGANLQAITYILKVIDLQQMYLAEDHPEVLDSYNLLCQFRYRNGDYSAAIKTQWLTISLGRIKLPSNNLLFANSYHTLGFAHFKLGRLDSAQFHFNQSYQILNSTLNKNHPNFIVLCENLALAYNDLAVELARVSKYLEALNLEGKAIALDPKRPHYLASYALIYALQGNLPAALQNLEKAIDLGFNDRQWLDNESAFDPLRDDPRYQSLLARLQP